MNALAFGRARPRCPWVSRSRWCPPPWRAELAAHDLSRAEALVTQRKAQEGATPDVIEAMSWLGRGAIAEGQPDRAEQHAVEAQRLALASLGSRKVDDDAHLANAIGASIEVQAQVSADRGARSDAIVFLERALATYTSTSLHKRIQKNINLLTLEGHPAPTLELSESMGAPLAAATAKALEGKVVVLFFWAHWCPDCKIEGPILELYASVPIAGAIVARRSDTAVAGGAASPTRSSPTCSGEDTTAFWPAAGPGERQEPQARVSSTPTVVLLDRKGIVRLYHGTSDGGRARS
jgi:thiol-disulfide isomerase/thioredoxin